MDYFKLIKEKDEEFNELDRRMQTDSDLLYLKKYVMMDKTGKHAVPDIINSTLNKPAVLAANVISALGAVQQQVIVESDSAKIDTHTIEEIINAVSAMANQRLRKQRYPNLNLAADVGLCIRGRHGRRVLTRMDDEGYFCADITSWDGRYIRYEAGENRSVWASFASLRTRGMIEADAEKNGWKLGSAKLGTTELVRDVWDTEHNEVLVGNRVVFEQGHDYGFTPVVLSTVTLGYGDILLDQNHLKQEGESIFFLFRDIIPELNRIASILSTQTFLSVKPPRQWESKDGDKEPPDYDEALAPGAITSAETGGGIKAIDYGDATRSAQLLYGMLEKAVQEGGYNDLDVGNVTQPFSAIALITIGEGRDQIHIPRLAAKEELNIDTSEMFIRQMIQIGGTLELGTPGHTKKYPMSKLEGEYTIDYKYTTKNSKTDIAQMAVAEQAEKWYPRRHIYAEVLKVEDPDGLMDDWYSQIAEVLDPNILKHRTIIRLLNKAEEDDDDEAAMEAKIMAEDMRLTVEQVKAGLTQPPAKPAQPEGGVPLLPEGGATESGIQPPAGRPELAMTAGVGI